MRRQFKEPMYIAIEFMFGIVIPLQTARAALISIVVTRHTPGYN